MFTRSPAAMGMILSVAFTAALAAPLFAAPAWQPPKDELITDKQVTSYIEVSKEYFAALKAAGKALQGQANPVVAGHVLNATDERLKAALARHGMTQEEYQWVAGKVWEANGALMLEEMTAKANKDLADKLKQNGDEQAALKQKVATCEKALKDCRRVMTADERAEAVKAARADQQSAEDEAKGHADIAKEAAAAAAKAEAEAKAALALAAKPPPEVSADDRENYIAGKKKDAEDAMTEAKEQREKEAEEKKSQADSQAKAAAAAARAKEPDVPVGEEEKAQVTKETQESLASAKADLQNAVEAEKILKDASARVQKNTADRQSKPASSNASVFKPHVKEFDDLLNSMK